jgi:hypothetical protein
MKLSLSSIAQGLAILSLSLFAPALRADTIIDTGASSDEISWSFNSSQYFGAQFQLTANTTLTDVAGFFGNQWGHDGTVTIAIHSDTGSTPGAVLDSAVLNILAGTAVGWNGLSSLSWNLDPGTYWVSFMPDSNISATMPGYVPNPAAAYAQGKGEYGWEGSSLHAFDYLKVGVRIEGTPGEASVTESSTTIALLGLSLCGLAAMARRQARRS